MISGSEPEPDEIGTVLVGDVADGDEELKRRPGGSGPELICSGCPQLNSSSDSAAEGRRGVCRTGRSSEEERSSGGGTSI
jgi:hypothetical protein